MPSYKDDQYDQDIAIGVLQAGLVEVHAWLERERGKKGKTHRILLANVKVG